MLDELRGGGFVGGAETSGLHAGWEHEQEEQPAALEDTKAKEKVNAREAAFTETNETITAANEYLMVTFGSLQGLMDCTAEVCAKHDKKSVSVLSHQSLPT